MPGTTGIERQDLALIACTILTGARDGAIGLVQAQTHRCRTSCVPLSGMHSSRITDRTQEVMNIQPVVPPRSRNWDSIGLRRQSIASQSPLRKWPSLYHLDA